MVYYYANCFGWKYLLGSTFIQFTACTAIDPVVLRFYYFLIHAITSNKCILTLVTGQNTSIKKNYLQTMNQANI